MMSQSQTGFLEEVVSWDADQCKDNMDTALPRLIDCLKEVDLIQEQIGILKIIGHSFLPCVDIYEAEETLFSKVVKEACKFFDQTLDEIIQYIENDNHNNDIKSDHVKTCLELTLDLIEFFESCVNHMQGGNTSLNWSHVHSLPYGTVHILKGAYGHCKSSGDLYKELLTRLSEPLSSVFKKTHSLQMSFLRLLDKVHLSTTVTHQDIEDLCLACHGLFDVCQIVASLDMKLVVTLWKAISKHAVNNKHHVQQLMEVGLMVQYLSREIQEGFQYLFQLLPQVDDEGMVMSQGDEKGFQKSLKILGFQMKIAVMIVREFSDAIHDCEEDVYNLLMNFHRLLPPSVHANRIQQKHRDELKQQLLNASDILIKSLLNNMAFTINVTAVQKVADLSDENCYPHLEILMKVMEMLPGMPDDIQSKWMNPNLNPEDIDRFSIVQAVILTFSKCYVELSLPIYVPGTVLSGKAQKDASLYENCCTRLCGFLGSLAEKHFTKLEDLLMENILCGNTWSKLLSEDVWCFLVRYGSAELCYDHVVFLMQFVKDSPFILTDNPLSSLIIRLIKCLAPEHKTDFLKRFPPGDSPALCYILACSVKWISQSNGESVMSGLVQHSLNLLQEFITSKQHLPKDFSNLLTGISCLHVMWPQFTDNQNISQSSTSTVIECLSQLWMSIFVTDWIESPVLELSLGRLIQFTTVFASSLDNYILIKMLSVMGSLLQQSCSQFLKLSIIYFLKSFGKVKLAASEEQMQMLNKLSEIFVKILTSHDALVHHHGLDAFTRFAEETMHESVVPNCIQKDNHLQDHVVAFLNKTPVLPSSHISWLDYLKTTKTQLSESENNNLPSSTNESCSKRQKLMMDGTKSDTSHQIGLAVRDLLEMFRECIPDLEQSCQTEYLPPQACQKLQNIQSQIQQLLKDNG